MNGTNRISGAEMRRRGKLLRTIIIGADMAGILAAIKLKERSVTIAVSADRGHH